MAKIIENSGLDFSRMPDCGPRVCDGSDADGTSFDASTLPRQDVGPQGDAVRAAAMSKLSDVRVKGRAALIRAYVWRDMARQSSVLSAKVRYLQSAMRDMRVAREMMKCRVILIRALGR